MNKKSQTKMKSQTEMKDITYPIAFKRKLVKMGIDISSSLEDENKESERKIIL